MVAPQEVEGSLEMVFFYGLFMDCELLKSKGFSPSNQELARLEGYGLRIGERATLVKSDNEMVFGVVVAMPGNQLEQLYGADSVVDYEPESVVALKENDNAINCVVYNLPVEKIKGCNASYAQSLSVVAQKVGLPSAYISEIETWAS